MVLLRRTFQVAVVLAVIYLVAGWGKRSFENYCPFGGMESLYSLVGSKSITCAISPWNFAVFGAVLGLTLLAKKSFCGWVCPVGFMYELLGKVQKRLVRRKAAMPPPAVDRRLRYLRYGVLALVLVFTWKTGELVFRGYDPFYLVYSGIGHGTAGTASIILLAVLLASGLLFKMSWCRYLCPMSAIMDPFSAASPVVVTRDPRICTECRSCDKQCAHDLAPSRRRAVTHRDCTNCLDCVGACPEEGCLALALHHRLKRTTP